MAVHDGWMRTYAIVVVSILFVFALIDMALAASNIAAIRNFILTYTYEDAGPENYPASLTALLVALATMIHAAVTFFFLYQRKANGFIFGGITTFFAVAWLALFAYESYQFNQIHIGEILSACSSYYLSAEADAGCSQTRVAVAWYSFMILLFVVCVLFASIAFRAGFRERNAGTTGTAYTQPQYEYSQQQRAPEVSNMDVYAAQQPAPMPQQQQFSPPAPSTSPAPGQPFYQDGRWMQTVPVKNPPEQGYRY